MPPSVKIYGEPIIKDGFQTGFPGALGDSRGIPRMGWRTAGSRYMCDGSRVELALGGAGLCFYTGYRVRFCGKKKAQQPQKSLKATIQRLEASPGNLEQNCLPNSKVQER